MPLCSTFVAHLLLAGVTPRVASIKPTLWLTDHTVAVRCAAPFYIDHLGESDSLLLLTIFDPITVLYTPFDLKFSVSHCARYTSGTQDLVFIESDFHFDMVLDAFMTEGVLAG